jgi:hypothetical protein
MNSNGVHNCNWTLAGADGAVTGVVVSEDWPPSTFFPCEGCSSRMFLSGTGIQSCHDIWVPASARTTRKDPPSRHSRVSVIPPRALYSHARGVVPECFCRGRESIFASLHGSPHPRGRQKTRHSRRLPSFPRRWESSLGSTYGSPHPRGRQKGVIPTKVGIQSCHDVWVPASARTTEPTSQS